MRASWLIDASRKEWERAGSFYFKTGSHQKALHLFLKCGEQCLDKVPLR